MRKNDFVWRQKWAWCFCNGTQFMVGLAIVRICLFRYLMFWSNKNRFLIGGTLKLQCLALIQSEFDADTSRHLKPPPHTHANDSFFVDFEEEDIQCCLAQRQHIIRLYIWYYSYFNALYNHCFVTRCIRIIGVNAIFFRELTTKSAQKCQFT